MDTINPERLALLEKYGFFRFFDPADLSIAEFANSECSSLRRWGFELEPVIKDLGLLLAEWSAIVRFRAELLTDVEDSHEKALAVFAERISGITFFGKYDPDFDRTELREILFYVIHGQPWPIANISLFDYWIESCRMICKSLTDEQASQYLADLRMLESKFHPIDGFSKYPRLGLRFWQEAINIALRRAARPDGQPAPIPQVTARTVPQKPLGNIYGYLRGLDIGKFKDELYQRGILTSSYSFIPAKNTSNKLAHILALPYILQHHSVIDESFFECTQLERTDIYTASFQVSFARSNLASQAISDFMTRLKKKKKSHIAWAFYNEIAEAVQVSRIQG